ncbi:mechanosensitive ion channel family protein [Candidatus Micrarchaeota archaeon]|nr:mechanosensitive ion channel family protein [Candidatus Micrarchaeota archaeon]
MILGFTIPYMEELLALPGGQITAFIILFAVLAITLEALLVIALKIAGFLVGKTKTTLDDRILKVLGSYLPYISVVTSLWISLEAVYPGMILFEGYKEFDIYVIVMMAILGFLLSSLANAILIWYGMEIRTDKKKVRENEVFPFVRNVVSVSIVLIFAVFILQRLGFETGAIITGLGVGGLAVALALQDTLGNFFAGVHILVDKPFREDDAIKLENGLEGTVKQIGWRTTRLVTLADNEVIVPNSKLAGSILENYSSPQNLSGVVYVVGVDYKEDIDNVEKIMLDSLRSVAIKNDLMDGSSVWVRFDSFGDYSLNFKFGYCVKGYMNRFKVLKEVNRELFYAFKKSGINIPFPVRVLYNAPVPESRLKAEAAKTERKK